MSPRVPLLGVPLALLLGACAVGPDYVRPALPSAAAYPEVVGGVAEVGAAWWEGFAEPELDRLVVRALAANAELRLAVARVEEAAAQFDDTSAAGLPAVDATAGDSGYKVSTGSYVPVGGTAAGRSRRTLRGGLSTSFELDFWVRCAGPRKAPGRSCSPRSRPPRRSA